MNGVKVMAIFSVFFASVFMVGTLLLLLTSQCRCCQGWCRKASLVVIDICLWIMGEGRGNV